MDIGNMMKLPVPPQRRGTIGRRKTRVPTMLIWTAKPSASTSGSPTVCVSRVTRRMDVRNSCWQIPTYRGPDR